MGHLSPVEQRYQEPGMKAAIEAAQAFRGATFPNPTVGAAAWNREGQLLAVAAHARAGTPHAEAALLADLRRRSLYEQIHSVFVTLEPCNHQGRTGPCTRALLESPVREVLIGARDPNPDVLGGGVEALRRAEVHVIELGPGPLRSACEELIAPFRKRVLTGRPWITVKTAHRSGGLDLWEAMIPPDGPTLATRSNTFTSKSSLELAHGLRRRSDALLTGSGTVLADDPLFTVRRVKDHSDRAPRLLALLDRRRRVPEAWLERARVRGFEPFRAETLEDAWEELGRRGCLEVLVEAGPSVSRAVLEGNDWDEWVRITAGEAGRPDRVDFFRRGDVHRNR